MARYSGSDWTPAMLEDIWEDVARIAKKYDLDYFPPEITIISSQEMVENAPRVAMPVMYDHWSFGKQLIQEEQSYKTGRSGLAFEVVINTNPSICYVMENNSLAIQILVICHAAVGHSAFFKNNYMFQQYTDPEGIVDFLIYTRDYIRDCETKYGEKAVEQLIDACHALEYFSIDKTLPPKTKTLAVLEALKKLEDDQEAKAVNAMWDTLFPKKKKKANQDLNEENLLKFVMQNSSKLHQWQKTIISMLIHLARYFYPQMQTQVSNEGFASFWHYTLLHDLFEEGLIDESIMLECLDLHAGVLRESQAFYRLHDADDDFEAGPILPNNRYRGFNPYWLGFNIYSTIRQICENPTARDKEEFPHLANTDWVEAVKDAAYNYNDSSFIRQFLASSTIDKLRLMSVEDLYGSPVYTVTGTAHQKSYEKIKKLLSRQYDINYKLPQIHIEHCNLTGDRDLYLRFDDRYKRRLYASYRNKTMEYIKSLWDRNVIMVDDRGALTV